MQKFLKSKLITVALLISAAIILVSFALSKSQLLPCGYKLRGDFLAPQTAYCNLQDFAFWSWAEASRKIYFIFYSPKPLSI
ncbi:hypothetical protein HY025_00375 [Candidatus Daviesbacteria bacterium]|nr:hypothetical protein [Candidatus Daviesbacteria bacterium]